MHSVARNQGHACRLGRSRAHAWRSSAHHCHFFVMLFYMMVASGCVKISHVTREARYHAICLFDCDEEARRAEYEEVIKMSDPFDFFPDFFPTAFGADEIKEA